MYLRKTKGQKLLILCLPSLYVFLFYFFSVHVNLFYIAFNYKANISNPQIWNPECFKARNLSNDTGNGRFYIWPHVMVQVKTPHTMHTV